MDILIAILVFLLLLSVLVYIAAAPALVVYGLVNLIHHDTAVFLGVLVFVGVFWTLVDILSRDDKSDTQGFEG